MYHITCFRFLGFLAASVFFALPDASAGVMTQQVPLVGAIGNQSSLSIAKFNPTLGSLTEVRMSYDLFAVAQFVAGNPDPSGPHVAFFDVTSSISLGSYISGPLLGRGAAVFLPGFSFPGGAASQGVGFAYVLGHGSTALSDLSSLNLFSATNPAVEQLNLPVSIAPLSSSRLAILDTISLLTGRVSVTYLFDEAVAEGEPADDGPVANGTVPEPASLAIFGIGALAMLLARGRRVR